jgi:serine/threonine protein kinase
MSLKSTSLNFIGKYGSAASTVAKAVLPFVAPGSETLIKIAEKLLDASGKISDKIGENQWRDELRGRLGVQDAELQRLGELFEFLLGPLSVLCDQVRQVSDQVDKIPDVLAKALAEDPSLSNALHGIEAIKAQTAAFQADLRRQWAENQAEAIPLYRRANRFYDFFDELQTAGVTAETFASMILSWHEIADKIRRGATADLDGALSELRRVAPKSASAPVLEAAARVREFDYAAAQRPLRAALRLKPDDAELLEITRGVTKLEDDTKPGGKKPPRLQPGDVLDRWRLESHLGAGGWGLVFKALRGAHTRAIKVMHRDLAQDDAFVTRFNKEITNLIKLPRHPNLVSIGADKDVVSFGFCKTHQTWYLAMEYIDGPTLEAYLAAKGPLTEGQVRFLFQGAVAGLAEAHKAGIVHRDIKPGNLIIRKSDKKLVFVDFGLAAAIADAGKTGTSGVTVNFAAPEQHYGKSATMRSDVYSLCAVMHYALTYDKPERRTPEEFHPDEAPAALRPILERGLKGNPRERFEDAVELLAAMTRAKTPPPPPPPSPPPETPAELARRLKSGKGRWDKTSFFADAQQKLAPADVQTIERFYDRCVEMKFELSWGTGKVTGTFSIKGPASSTKSLVTVASHGKLSLNFGWWSGSEVAERVRDRLKELVIQRVGLPIADDYKTKWPSFPISEWGPKADELANTLRDILAEFRD